MDIVELSRRMEANGLDNQSDEVLYLKPVLNDSFSPRLTRSQRNKSLKNLTDRYKINIPLRQNHTKVSEIEGVYLNKKAKVAHKNLETIYEDPIWKKGSTVLLGTSKVKRSIYLDREFRITSKQKSKLRKMKIKRLGKKTKPFKLTDEEFKSKMLRVENYINGNDVESESKNEDCNIEFDNCDNNEDCSDLENGNVKSRKTKESNVNKNKDLDLQK